MTLVNVSERSATLFQLSLAFIVLLKLFDLNCLSSAFVYETWAWCESVSVTFILLVLHVLPAY